MAVHCPQCNHEFDPLGQPRPKDATVDRPESLEISGTADALSARSRRHHSSPRWMWFCVLGLFLASAALGLAYGMNQSWNPRSAAIKQNSPPEPTPPVPTQVAPGDAETNDAERSDVDRNDVETNNVARIEKSLVEIRSNTPQGTTNLATGFVIDASGLIATNYHVVADSTRAVVHFKGGEAYQVEGYAAIEPNSDLAILKLIDAPGNFVPVRLAPEARLSKLDTVVAWGHPHGLSFSPFDGRISRIVPTGQLPLKSQEFLRQTMPAVGKQQWIQHTANLSEGNSGGPLLDAGGAVIGINTWVDKKTGFNYAIRAAALDHLSKNLLDDVVPLEEFASREARDGAARNRLMAGQLDRLYEQAREMNWAPRDEQQYLVLQELAWSLTAARLPGGLGIDSATQPPLSRQSFAQEADQIEARLMTDRWQAFQQVTLINEQAARQLDQSSTGLFFFATVDRVVAGEDGVRGMLCELAGFKKTLLIPLDGIKLDPEPGTHCLVLGVNHRGQQVHYGDNPLKLNRAPVIISRLILVLEE